MLDYLTSNCIAAGEVLLGKLQELKIPIMQGTQSGRVYVKG
jgi:hypothetical protein